jgi:predicted RNA-binding Zn-ribbon protein involved in translation (DUF1610 family)
VSRNDVKRCSCGDTMQFAEEAKFRVGGTSGGWKLVFGEWAELGESMIPLSIFVCPTCGKIELFASEETKQKLLSIGR